MTESTHTHTHSCFTMLVSTIKKSESAIHIHTSRLNFLRFVFFFNERGEKSPSLPDGDRRMGSGILNLQSDMGCDDKDGCGTTSGRKWGRRQKGQGCSGCRALETWP